LYQTKVAFIIDDFGFGWDELVLAVYSSLDKCGILDIPSGGKDLMFSDSRGINV
jgi:hypothetical protein